MPRASMQVQMTHTVRESPDGITGYVYQAGVAYDVPVALGKKMIAEHHAEEVLLDDQRPEARATSHETKVDKGMKEPKA